MKIFLTFLLLSQFVFSIGHTDSQTNNGSLLVIPLIVENSSKLDGKLTGNHGKIIKQILEQNRDNISYSILPPTHAYQAFYDQNFVCVTPDSKKYYDTPNKYIDSRPISVAEWVVVQRKGTLPITSKNQLIGLTVGSFYPQEEIATILPKEGVSYDVKANFTVNLLKVALQRIDIAILPKEGLEELIQGNSTLQNISFDISPPIAIIADTIMCHNNDQGKALIKSLNKTIDRLPISPE